MKYKTVEGHDCEIKNIIFLCNYLASKVFIVNISRFMILIFKEGEKWNCVDVWCTDVGHVKQLTPSRLGERENSFERFFRCLGPQKE